MRIKIGYPGWNWLGNYKAGRVTKHHGHNRRQGTITSDGGGKKLQFEFEAMEVPRILDGRIVIDGKNRRIRPRRPRLGTKVLYLERDNCADFWTTLAEVQKLIWLEAGGK